MRIELPFSYTVNAVPYRHKQHSNMTCYEYATVDVPELTAAELEPVAMVRSRSDGALLEELFGYDGGIWVRNRRMSGQIPFLEQHLRYAGHMPGIPEDRYGSPKVDRKAIVGKAAEFLGAVGIFQNLWARISDYDLKERRALRGEDGGIRARTITPETEQMKKLEESDRDERMVKLIRAAAADLVCCGGELYVRVPEPLVAVKTGWYPTADWRFGGGFIGEKTLTDHVYPVSMLDIERIPEFFFREHHGDPVVSPVTCEIADATYFRRDARKIALMKDVLVELRTLDTGYSTPLINAWTALRDFVGTCDGKSLGQDEAFYDQVASLADTMVRQAVADGREKNLVGLEMFDARSVSTELADAPPSP